MWTKPTLDNFPTITLLTERSDTKKVTILIFYYSNRNYTESLKNYSKAGN